MGEDAIGSAQCGGDLEVSLPLRWVLNVTGDLLHAYSPPNVPGIQACPLCDTVCQGGTKADFPCDNDTDCPGGTCSTSTICLGGPNDGLSCTPQTSRLDVHSCCANGANDGQRCETDADCAPPPGPAPRCELSYDPCTDDSDCTAIPNDTCIKCVLGCTSFPTSHDCPPNPATDLTFGIGGLRTEVNLTTSSQTINAVDLAESSRVFCGFCRDMTGHNSLCFEGDTDPGCPVAVPPAVGHPIPCVSDSDCNDGDEYESCAQRNSGAIGRAGATRITVTGSKDGQCLGDGELHTADLVGFFCIPPSFDHGVDNSADLPGPGVELLHGAAKLWSPSGAFLEVTNEVLD